MFKNMGLHVLQRCVLSLFGGDASFLDLFFAGFVGDVMRLGEDFGGQDLCFKWKVFTFHCGFTWLVVRCDF